jgi:hypothetical protein
MQPPRKTVTIPRRAISPTKETMNAEVTRLLDSMERHRPFRAIFYAFLLGAGAVLSSDPWSSLDRVGGVVRYGWGGFLILGGILTLYGTFVDKWKTELQGDILLGTSIAGFIFVLVKGSGTTGSIVVACLLAALLTAISSRVYGLWRLGNAHSRIERKREQQQKRSR